MWGTVTQDKEAGGRRRSKDPKKKARAKYCLPALVAV
jgi:hypothetical protein